MMFYKVTTAAYINTVHRDLAFFCGRHLFLILGTGLSVFLPTTNEAFAPRLLPCRLAS